MRPVFFGLRTALGSVVPEDCGPTARAKQGALLFDHLLFEAGSLLLRLDGDSVVEHWMRPLAPGASREHEWELINRNGPPSGPVVSYDTLLDALRVMDVEWAGVVVPPAEMREPALAPVSGQPWNHTPSSTWMGEALQRDLDVARRLEASLTTTPFFSQLLLVDHPPAPMPRAVVSPDPSSLSWEEVIELRGHGSVRAARRLMHEVLALARADDPVPMLSTLDVLAPDIGSLLTDAVESLRGEMGSLIVTRVAVPPEDMAGAASPVIVMETHSTRP